MANLQDIPGNILGKVPQSTNGGLFDILQKARQNAQAFQNSNLGNSLGLNMDTPNTGLVQGGDFNPINAIPKSWSDVAMQAAPIVGMGVLSKLKGMKMGPPEVSTPSASESPWKVAQEGFQDVQHSENPNLMAYPSSTSNSGHWALSDFSEGVHQQLGNKYPSQAEAQKAGELYHQTGSPQLWKDSTYGDTLGHPTDTGVYIATPNVEGQPFTAVDDYTKPNGGGWGKPPTKIGEFQSLDEAKKAAQKYVEQKGSTSNTAPEVPKGWGSLETPSPSGLSSYGQIGQGAGVLADYQALKNREVQGNLDLPSNVTNRSTRATAPISPGPGQVSINDVINAKNNLYHNTGFSGVMGILRDEMIKPSQYTDSVGASMTRVPQIATKGGNFTFVIDPNYLPKSAPLAESAYGKTLSGGAANPNAELEVRTKQTQIPLTAMKGILANVGESGKRVSTEVLQQVRDAAQAKGLSVKLVYGNKQMDSVRARMMQTPKGAPMLGSVGATGLGVLAQQQYQQRDQ